ncbi:hypothetical protein [uncultured Shimia sp.]|uniref:hypothetical protein n=1 Tax=uncultured Shimia sp. TaxID=573152 RepID=UPI002628D12E|nr:hypothetical protein [uncultured Shimia sp.]
MNHPDPHQLPPLVDLAPGEIQKEIWRPQFRFFLLKISFVSGLTTVIFGGAGSFALSLSGFLIWVGAFVISAAIYAFVFDDYLEWRARKDDVWILTDRRLIYYNPNDDSSPAFVPLAQVKQVKRWMFWALRVQLYPRDQVMMVFVPERQLIKDAILKYVDIAATAAPQKVQTP